MSQIIQEDSAKNTVDPFEEIPLFAGLEGFLPARPASPVSVKPSPASSGKKKVARKNQSNPAPPSDNRTVNPSVSQTKKRPESLFLSVSDMCALLGISRATLVRMDKKDAIPGRIKLGGSVRYHRETVETWVAALVAKK